MQRAFRILAVLTIITVSLMACSSQGNKAKEANDQGVDLFKKGQYDQAIAKFNQAIQLDPKYAIAYDNRALVEFLNKSPDKALADVNKAIELNPKIASAYYLRRLISFSHENYKKAIVDYNKAIEINPKFVVAYNNRGLATIVLTTTIRPSPTSARPSSSILSWPRLTIIGPMPMYIKRTTARPQMM
jgi:tetratricopeptide (TPR) repeat protein